MADLTIRISDESGGVEDAWGCLSTVTVDPEIVGMRADDPSLTNTQVIGAMFRGLLNKSVSANELIDRLTIAYALERSSDGKLSLPARMLSGQDAANDASVHMPDWKAVAHDALERLQELEEVGQLEDGIPYWTSCGEPVGGKEAWHGGRSDV